MATVASTSTSSATCASETQWRPPATSRARVTTSWASRDLPTPPGPVTVTSPAAVQADARCCSSVSRPTNDVAGRRDARGAARRLAAQDVEVRRHRVRAGVDTQLGRQRRAAGLERTHRTGPVAGELQRPDQGSMRAFVQRMGGGQPASERDGRGMVAQLAVRRRRQETCLQHRLLETVAVRLQPLRVQAGRELGRVEARGVGEPGQQGVPAARGSEPGRRGHGGVQCVDVGAHAGREAIARRRGDHELRPQGGQTLPQVTDQSAYGDPPGRGRLVPDERREALGRKGAGLEGQGRQHEVGPATTQPGSLDDLGRAPPGDRDSTQQGDAHATMIGTPPARPDHGRAGGRREPPRRSGPSAGRERELLRQRGVLPAVPEGDAALQGVVVVRLQLGAVEAGADLLRAEAQAPRHDLPVSVPACR